MRFDGAPCCFTLLRIAVYGGGISLKEFAMRTQLPSALLVTALACSIFTVSAQAQSPRTFVSAAGSDSNNCANVATPCRHLAAAFGSLTITGPVSIEGHGWASIAPVSGNPAITINALGATDKINIIGVVLDGTNLAGTTGIEFNSGGSLTVRDSVIRNFTNDGIAFLPNSSGPSQLFVSNTLVSDSGGDGIIIDPSGTGITNSVINHVEMENNGFNGLLVQTGTQAINVTVSDSVSANNGRSGINSTSTGGTSVNIMVRNSTIANNAGNGLTADKLPAAIFVTRSTITGNFSGWTTVAGGTVGSYADNNIDLNGGANTEPPGPLPYH
jgi:hypothetical protein